MYPFLFFSTTASLETTKWPAFQLGCPLARASPGTPEAIVHHGGRIDQHQRGAPVGPSWSVRQRIRTLESIQRRYELHSCRLNIARPQDYDDTEVPLGGFFPVQPTSPTYVVVDTVPELIYERSWLYRGDSDDDGDRDLADYGGLQDCHSPEADSVPAADPCSQMDMDNDRDVDSGDFADFISGFDGPR